MAIRQTTQDLVRRRANGLCEYCRCPEFFATQPHSIEHVLPRAQGGSDAPSNLSLACQGCNNHKYVKTQALDDLTGETVRLFHPRTMNWEDHFSWSSDYSEIMPLTAIGRVTIRELCLNRTGVGNIRRILYATGEHPPKR